MSIITETFIRAHGHGMDWVDPRRENLTEREAPYCYSEYFVWRDPKLVDPHGGHDGQSWRATEISVVFSDRLAQQDREKFSAAIKACGATTSLRYWSENNASAFLTAYFGKPTMAVALAEGCNSGNGYPYWIFWYRSAETGKDGCTA